MPLELRDRTGGAAGACESVERVVIDSREVRRGDLFVAIAGDRHDGHDHVAEAFDRGAVGAIVEREPEATGGWWIRVDDSVRALAQLAEASRARFAGRLVAVTGSSGKTTCKNLITQVLGEDAVGAKASFNNHIGVPLTLLAIEADTRHAVLEIGTSSPGEIGPLAKLARPHIALITTVGESHLRGLGDVHGVAREKGALLDALPSDGIAILPRDNRFFKELRDRSAVEVHSFGFHADSSYRILSAEDGEQGLEVTLRLPDGEQLQATSSLRGRHNALNLVATTAAAHQLGMAPAEIADRLAACTAAPMRMESLRLGSVFVVNDAYNANPMSMRAALEAFGNIPTNDARRVAVLGDMRELGPESARYHREVVELALSSGLDRLVLVGPRMQIAAGTVELSPEIASRLHVDVFGFEDPESFMDTIGSVIEPGDAVLLKGSRAVALERCVPHLEIIGRKRVETAA